MLCHAWGHEPGYQCCRLGSGAFVSGKLADFKKRPKEPIILYEFDACPFCRKVGLPSSCCNSMHVMSPPSARATMLRPALHT